MILVIKDKHPCFFGFSYSVKPYLNLKYKNKTHIVMTNSLGSTKTPSLNSTKPKIRILIVDDQKMIREGLKALLQTESDLQVVGTADNGEDSIKQVETFKPDIVLMDMEMPGMDGVSATRVICEKFPDVRVLVLSTFDTEEYVARSLSSGAMGYLLKGTPAPELTNAIRSVYLGYAQIGPGIYQNLPLVPKGDTDTGYKSSLSATSNINAGASQLSPRLSQGLSVVNESESSSAMTIASRSGGSTRKFEQTVMLRPSPKWSRFTVWGVGLVTLFAISWAAVAKIEQVVPAQGQLKPEGKVKEVQIPTSGVVEEVRVEEGQRVEKGDILLVLDSTTSAAQLESLKNIRRSLLQQNKFYRSLMGEEIGLETVDASIASLEIPREITFLARNRAQLQAENDLLRAQLGGSSENLSLEQQVRLRTAQSESRSRTAAARLEVEQLERQLNQNQVQLEDAREQLVTGRRVLAEIEQRNREASIQAEESLRIEEETLKSLEPLAASGAIAPLQIERQKQQVSDRRGTIISQKASGKIEYDNQKQQVVSTQAEINRLQEEAQRLRLDIAQAREQLINTTAFSDRDVLDSIADNKQRIADIDTELNRRIVDNTNRAQELQSQIISVEETLRYQNVEAPVSGLIFDLEAYRGYVPPAGQAAQPVLKIIPEDKLIAEVFIRPEDIGFVSQEEQTATDVRITAFPFGEFGDVKGRVTFIGKDALQPEPPYDFFRYPAKVELDQQFINIRGEDLPLKSGMAVQANIRIKENRTVLMLLFDKFFVGLDKFKET